MRTSSHSIRVMLAALGLFFVIAAFADSPDQSSAGRPNSVLGEKLDSGLGALTAPDVRDDPAAGRLVRIPGEKLDSGLGELTGPNSRRDPAAGSLVSVPGEKLDSGLGDLPQRMKLGSR